MMKPLEGFEPNTPTEMMLWNEIRRLRSIGNIAAALHDGRIWEPKEIEMRQPLPAEFKLVPESMLIANIGADGTLQVKLRGRSKAGTYESGYYVRHPRSIYEATNSLAHLHKSELGKLAKMMLGDEP